MENWELALVTSGMSIRDAIRKIDIATTKMALVVDDKRFLLGTLGDGDIRRGLIQGRDLSDSVDTCMHLNPTTAKVGDTDESILLKMRQFGIHQIPILNEEGIVVGLRLINNFLNPKKRDNLVIIMAGGLGSRLKDMTKDIPKPLLKVGNKPILETIIKRFVDQGFINIWLAVNYHANKIEEYFGDGTSLGANISYIKENIRLGTAGALSLLPEKPKLPFFVTNADLLATVDYIEMLDAHLINNSDATMAVREYEYQIPFGVIDISENSTIISLREKPVNVSLVNAGMYILSPDVIDLVPKNRFYDMPELFSEIVEKKFKVMAHKIHGYWMDIGRHEDFHRANIDYREVFND